MNDVVHVRSWLTTGTEDTRGKCSKCGCYTLDGVTPWAYESRGIGSSLQPGSVLCRPCAGEILSDVLRGECWNPECKEDASSGTHFCSSCTAALIPCEECGCIGPCSCRVRQTRCPGCDEWPSCETGTPVTWCEKCTEDHLLISPGTACGTLTEHRCYDAGRGQGSRETREELEAELVKTREELEAALVKTREELARIRETLLS